MRDLIETIDPWLGYSGLLQELHHTEDDLGPDAYDLARGFYSRRSVRTGLPPARRETIRRTIRKPAARI